jgi:thiamine-phosphate pyrophosphorylase
MSFSFVVITPEEPVENELQILRSLLQMGAWRVHLRHPALGVSDLTTLLQGFTESELKRVTLSREPALLSRFPSIGYHLKEGEALSAQCQRAPYLSASCHDPQRIPREVLDYVFLGPLFDSISKPGYLGSWPKNHLPERLDTEPKRFALGGVHKDALPQLKSMGFEGAALLGSIWKARDPLLAFDEMMGAK